MVEKGWFMCGFLKKKTLITNVRTDENGSAAHIEDKSATCSFRFENLDSLNLMVQ